MKSKLFLFCVVLLCGSALATIQPSTTATTLSFIRKDYALPGVNYGGDLAVGDFNGDGNVDVAVTNTDASSSTLQVFLGRGDGTFQAPTILALPFELDLLKVGDFNGDGKLDLAGTNLVADGQMLLGNGDGTFTIGPYFSLNFGIDIVQMVAGDINGDNKLDLVIVWNDGARVEADVELGNGDGTFNDLPKTLGLNYFGGAPTLGDFNQDGKIDVAVPDSYVGSPLRAIDIFLGNGDGTFQPRRMYSTQFANAAAAAADLNGDGLLDVVTDGVSVLLNNGNGLHKAGGEHNTPGAPSLQVADLNRDGALDVVTNTRNDTTLAAAISVRLGDGDGTFQPPLVLSNNYAFRAGDFGIADFNGDGKLDVVTYNTTLSNQVQFSVFLQQ